MTDKKLYKKIYKIIEKHNIAALPLDSNDEYEPEVKDIVTLDFNQPAETLALRIKEIFTEWFDKCIIPEDNNIYLNIASEIKQVYAKSQRKLFKQK